MRNTFNISLKEVKTFDVSKAFSFGDCSSLFRFMALYKECFKLRGDDVKTFFYSRSRRSRSRSCNCVYYSISKPPTPA